MNAFTRAGLVLCAIVLVAACGPGAASPSPGASPTVAPTPRPPDLPLSTPPAVTGVPPAVMEAVTAEAARLSGVAADQVTILRAEPAVWPDGSLGCPQPDQMYTQALVNGYWIVLQAGTTPYDFRVGSEGTFTLCLHPETGEP